MARYTRAEFCDLCGVSSGDLSNYIKRGKVVVDGDGFDSENALNAAFIKKREGRQLKKKSSSPKVAEKKEKPQGGYVNALQQKAEVDIQAKRQLIELKNLEIRKKLGEMIPTDSVRQIFIMHSENMKTAYMESSDNIIVIMGQRKEFNAEDVAYVRKKFYDLVNKAISDTITATKVSIDNLVKEFSEKRGVGQHD